MSIFKSFFAEAESWP